MSERPDFDAPFQWTEYIVALEADRDRLREALSDFAGLLPPERWRLLRRETNKTLGNLQAALNEQSEGG